MTLKKIFSVISVQDDSSESNLYNNNVGQTILTPEDKNSIGRLTIINN